MTELVENDRTIGGLSKESTKQVADFYESEKEFTKLLLRRLKNRNGNPQDGHDLPD
jgi:hypothetical protein